jgi:hypothetical protein
VDAVSDAVESIYRQLKILKDRPYLVVDFPSEKHLNFVRQPHRYKVLLGGNRSGKTETCAIEVIWHLLGEHPFVDVPTPPVRWRIHVVDYSQLEKVVNEKLRKYIPEHKLYGGKWDTAYNGRLHLLRLQNGSVVDITTHRSSVKALEGASLDGVWIDEECPQQQYRALLYRVIDRKGRVFISATPLSGVTWLYNELVEPFENGNPEIHVSYISTYDNKYIDTAAIQLIEETSAPEEKEIRLYGKIQNYSKRVFSAFDRDRHVDEFPLPPTPTVWVGLDWGFHHPTALVYAVYYNDNFYVIDEFENDGLSLERIGEIIEDWCLSNGFSQQRCRVVYDSAMNRPLPDGMRREIDVLRPFGFRLIPSVKNLELSVGVVNELFRNDSLFIHRKCTRLIEHMNKFYYRNGVVRSDDPDKDMCDALRYVLFAMNFYYNRGYEEYEEEMPRLLYPSAKAKLQQMIVQRRLGEKRRGYI